MPIYEYDCDECGARFDTLVRRTDETVACPECGSERVSKRLSVFAAGRSGGAPAAPA